MDDLISRKAAIDAMCEYLNQPIHRGSRRWTKGCEAVSLDLLFTVNGVPSIPAVPLEPLCSLLAEMYHCPSSGWPSSGHACHPSCPDEAFEKLCGTDCENYSDAERWKAFLTKWKEGLEHG